MAWLTERDAPQYAFDPSSISGNFAPFDRDVGAHDVEERIIAPIPDKSEGLKQVFIRDTYSKAEALLRASDMAVAIGYSFNRHDGGSYRRLLGALGQSPGRKMLVVSPDAGAIVKTIRPAHPNISITPMDATFKQWVAASFPGLG
jgi:hypothetical protein